MLFRVRPEDRGRSGASAGVKGKGEKNATIICSVGSWYHRMLESIYAGGLRRIRHQASVRNARPILRTPNGTDFNRPWLDARRNQHFGDAKHEHGTVCRSGRRTSQGQSAYRVSSASTLENRS